MVRCRLIVYRLQFLEITDNVLRRTVPAPFLSDITIINVAQEHELAGAHLWRFNLVLKAEDEHVRTTNWRGKLLDDKQLRHAPWTALSRLERALRHAWAGKAGSRILSDGRNKSLEMLD